MEQNHTRELVHLPHGHRPISLKWVFKLTKNKLGAVIKHKARLVVRDFVQQEGIDYGDAFALVARMELVWVLALAAQEGRPPYGCQISLPQRQPQGRGVRAATTWLRLCRRRKEGLQASQSSLWPAASSARMEREAGCDTQENGLPAERP